MAKPGRMHKTSSTSTAVARPLGPGMMLYPTGQEADTIWEVDDERGNEGEVSSLLYRLSKWAQQRGAPVAVRSPG
jgi:hypothetical protein